MNLQKLIVGLGNIGKKYDCTYHNVGFIIIDQIAQYFGVSWSNKEKFSCLLSNVTFKDCNVLLCKPTTYMNLSGISVQSLCNYYKIPTKDVIVIQDDLDMKFGKIRVKISNSSGGHNGIKSISQKIGNNYLRCKIGIGRPVENKMEISDYVLSKMSSLEQDILFDSANKIIDNIDNLIFSPSDFG
jgi:PTH1 family peptidyl-tRNA hydrolase